MNAASPGITEGDAEAVAAQLGRGPRGLQRVAHRCPCGLPDVVQTAPRLPDGTPFPTVYYLTCPRATAAVSGLEAAGRMREMTERLADGELKARYGLPLLVSLSRKGFLRKLVNRPPLEAGAASLAAELFAEANGADYIRTHTPGPLKDGLKVLKTIGKEQH